MLTIDKIHFTDQGRMIEYEYQYSNDIKKYFTGVPLFVRYDVDISAVPTGILNLPLLANLLPISWFVGFDIKVAELDAVFYGQVSKLKEQFAEYFPIIGTKESNLIVERLTDHYPKEMNPQATAKTAMLYSGGVDACATLLRHFDEVPDLITVKGVDMDLHDEVQWKRLLNFNSSKEIIQKNRKHYIQSNVVSFISFEINRFISGFNWYGSVQHGLALNCLTAPLAYLNDYTVVYIASSFDRTQGYEFVPWGSIPEIDNLIAFNTTKIGHDGIELTRQDKTTLIADWAAANNKQIDLRVCLSTKKDGLNCGHCSKCLMTIFAILNTNSNPNRFGFQVDLRVFDYLKTLLKKGFKSHVVVYFWKEVYVSSQTSIRFNESDPDWKRAYMEIDPLLKEGISRPIKGDSFIKKAASNLFYRFPWLYRYYLKLK